MRKISFAFLLAFLLVSPMSVSAEIDSGTPELKELLPQDDNYKWSYSGFVEYGHEMEIASITKTEDETYYSINGNVYDASGGASGADYSLSLSYIVNSDVLVQTKEEEQMLDSKFDRIELIRSPLEEGTTWTQTVTDQNGNDVTVNSEITNVTMENGHYVFTVRYEDRNSLYFEERKIKENVGVVFFKKLMINQDDDNYEVTYRINEDASGVQTTKQFSDVSRDDWYMKYVPSLTSLDIIHGYPDGTFQPKDEVTVAEFLKLILHSISYKSDNGTNVWYSPYVETAINMGIIEEGEFNNYNRDITREEMVKIMIKAIGEKPTRSGEISFTDEASISAEYQGYVDAAVQLGVITGYEDNTFRPDIPTNRGEAAKMLYYTVMLLEQKQMTPTDAIDLENKFENHLFPTTDGNKVVDFDTKEELIDHASKVMDRKLAKGYVENYYKEEDDGLYVIPKDGPTMIIPEQTSQLYKEDKHTYYMTQVTNSEFIGPYKLKVTYELLENKWIISDRQVDSHTGQDISVLDAIHYETIPLENLSNERQNTIENNKAQRGYILFQGETENEMILYVGSGEKSTGGYEIHVNAIVNQENTTKVYVKETAPSSDQAVTQSITYPSEIVKIANVQENIDIITTTSEKMMEIE